jgi:hypothetical protein
MRKIKDRTVRRWRRNDDGAPVKGPVGGPDRFGSGTRRSEPGTAGGSGLATLALYTVGMGQGGTVAVVPSVEERSAELAALLVPHGAHAVRYFGLDRVEELTGA